MRILVVGPDFLPWSLGACVRAILEDRGASVRTFAYARPSTDDETQRALLAACRTFRPDLLFGLKLDRIAPRTLRTIRRAGTRVLLWYVDCFERGVPGWLRARVRECDACFTSARGLVAAYEAIGATPVHWVMEGAYLPGLPPIAVTAGDRRLFGSEVAFVGSVYHETRRPRDFHARARLLRKVGARFDLKVWGPQGYPGTRERLGGALRLVPWPAYHADLVRVCRSAAIVLGSNLINSVELYFSNRTFLTLAAGGFHLTRYVPGLETLFENHKHLVWFRSDAECLELIEEYLARPRRRRAIAREGRRLVRSRYGMARQVGRILRAAL